MTSLTKKMLINPGIIDHTPRIVKIKNDAHLIDIGKSINDKIKKNILDL